MYPSNISPCINVAETASARKFYITHFDAVIAFDCGWYLNVEFGRGGQSLQFMEPQNDDQQLYTGGVTYNLKLDSPQLVDRMHERLSGQGLPIVVPLDDHPWGDRGFCTLDPYGVGLYIYAETEPTEEFRQYYR